MFFAKHKKMIVSIAAVAALSLGGVSAFAMTAGPALTPAGPLDLSKVDIVPGTFTVIEGTTLHIEGGDTCETAPGLTLTPASGNIDLDSSNVQEGTLTVVQGVTPQMVGADFTTAAK